MRLLYIMYKMYIMYTYIHRPFLLHLELMYIR
jgi:hypothetical protein